MTSKLILKMLASGCLALATVAFLPGCERKEKIIDIETPSGEIEVERDKDSGDVDIEATRDEDHE